MLVLRATSVVLLASSLVASLPLGDDPIVDLIREAIFEADEYIAQEHMDELKLPDFGFHPWSDPIKLRNGQLGNFSTIQLRGTPNATYENNPNGSMTFQLDLPLGLDHFGIFYDFRIDIVDIVSRVGNCSVWTEHNLADVSVTLRAGGSQKCSAILNSFVLKEFGKLQIKILPEDLPEIVPVGEFLLDFIALRLIPATNAVVKKIIETDFFRQKFSEIVCSKVPIYYKHL